MKFFADKQTLDDLNILGRHKSKSMSRLFDTVITEGGRKLMDFMFKNPLTNFEDLNTRSSIFRYFEALAIPFPFTVEEVNILENTLGSGRHNNVFSTAVSILAQKALQVAAQDKDYEQLNLHICKSIELLNRFNDFSQDLPLEAAYREHIETIKGIFKLPALAWLKKERGVMGLPFFKLIRYEHQLKTGLRAQLKQLIEMIFELDVYIAVSSTGKQRGFSYATALPRSVNTLTIVDLYHPAVENAIGNTVSLCQDNNVLFLTGADMAGKSTLTKSFGISIYLAHMGFPVAASYMDFSVKDGLYTSVNVPDSLQMRYSHFYTEVMRVKTIALELAGDKDLVVIFDELFKGINVKDASDAILSITEAFSANRKCFFVISTHITEAGQTISTPYHNFRFAYLPTVMDGLIPGYPYLLKDAVTTDRNRQARHDHH
jgi:DNA mismatch repair protein MutS